MGGLQAYSVVICPRCGEYRVVKRQKTFKCFKCGSTIAIQSSRIVASVNSADEARRVIAQLKMRRSAEVKGRSGS
ncbi:MAG: DUF1922 domain-containing protein [Nitrososphaerota archaeon]|nr:transposase [Candidatus Calditenuaceae archaeon]MDW8073076.1 DUF1922 domain-containing protein [Nitrososphaerota archaeon]